jgi:hypothetical protein
VVNDKAYRPAPFGVLPPGIPPCPVELSADVLVVLGPVVTDVEVLWMV